MLPRIAATLAVVALASAAGAADPSGGDGPLRAVFMHDLGTPWDRDPSPPPQLGWLVQGYQHALRDQAGDHEGACIDARPMPMPGSKGPREGQWTNGYVVVGRVEPAGSAYSVELAIRTGDGRPVARGAAPYDPARGDAGNAGAAAAASLLGGRDLSELLYEFERSERDKRKDAAIFPSMRIEPPSRVVPAGTSVPVTITVTDCDDYPLAGRKLEASAPDGGALSRSELEAGEDGTASVTFTPPGKKGAYGVGVAFSFMRPSDKPGFLTSSM